MSSNLIPFGLHISSGRLLDISEVERGKACECVCPACKQRLVARFCVDRSDHFAHDKDSSDQGVNEIECSLSFYVAMRLMIKQCLREMPDLLDFTIPPLEFNLGMKDRSGRLHEYKHTVTEPKQVNLRNVVVETKLDTYDIDVASTLGDYVIALHFYYPGRERFSGEVDSKVCLIEIDLTELDSIYRDFGKDEEIDISFKERVIKFVFGSIMAKSWFSHPLKEESYQIAAEHLREVVSNENESLKRIFKSKEERYGKHKGSGDYYCPRCDVAWFSEHKGTSCDRCFLPGNPLPFKPQ